MEAKANSLYHFPPPWFFTTLVSFVWRGHIFLSLFRTLFFHFFVSFKWLSQQHPIQDKETLSLSPSPPSSHFQSCLTSSSFSSSSRSLFFIFIFISFFSLFCFVDELYHHHHHPLHCLSFPSSFPVSGHYHSLNIEHFTFTSPHHRLTNIVQTLNHSHQHLCFL